MCFRDFCPCLELSICEIFWLAIMTRTAISINLRITCLTWAIRGSFDRYRRNAYVLATGWDDQCLGQNQRLDGVMSAKGIPHKLFVWDTYNSHDWPTWEKMVQHYL